MCILCARSQVACAATIFRNVAFASPYVIALVIILIYIFFLPRGIQSRSESVERSGTPLDPATGSTDQIKTINNNNNNNYS